MLGFLNEIDTSLFLFLNGLHHPSLDPIMLAISYNKYLMLSLLSIFIILGFFELRKKFIIPLIFVIISFGLSDLISTRVFKNPIKRLRPCHNQEISQVVHLAGKKCWGGKFGFVSSHASNSFALVFIFWLFLKRKRKFISIFFAYAGLVAYSRVYLARHYPGDIFFGALLGLLISYLVYLLYLKLEKTYLLKG